MQELTFGVEQEHFLFRKDGEVPTLEDMKAVFTRFEETGLFRQAYSPQGAVLNVHGVRGNQNGVVVKNDFCTNIIEVAFPPMTSLPAFVGCWLTVFDLLERCVEDSELKICLGGVLRIPPDKIQLSPCETDPDGSRAHVYLRRADTGLPLFHVYAGAAMASTQVSIGCRERELIPFLPLYYGFEYLVPLLFGNSFEHRATSGRCVRHFIYTHNWSGSHRLLAIPVPVPATVADYDLMKLSSYRDYSYVCLREGRVEFRSACSQNSLDRVLELIAFRAMVHAYCLTVGAKSIAEPHKLFSLAAGLGPTPTEHLEADLEALTRSCSSLGQQWSERCNAFLNRLENLLKSN